MSIFSLFRKRQPEVIQQLKEITGYLERSRATVNLDEFRVSGHCYRFRSKDIGDMRKTVEDIKSRFDGKRWKSPNNNYFVLAAPGCGKTTFAKQLGCSLKREKGIEPKRIDLKLPNTDLAAFYHECVNLINQGKPVLVTIDEFHRLFPRGSQGTIDAARANMAEPFRFSALNYDAGKPVVCMFIMSLFRSDETLRQLLRRSEMPHGEEFERRTRGTAIIPSSSAGDKFVVAAAVAFNYCFNRVDADALLALAVHPSMKTVADVSAVIKGLREDKKYLSDYLTRRDLTGFPKYSEEDLSLDVRKLLKENGFALNLTSSLPREDPEDEDCSVRDCNGYLRTLLTGDAH